MGVGGFNRFQFSGIINSLIIVITRVFFFSLARFARVRRGRRERRIFFE